jgi:hypothetical protein
LQRQTPEKRHDFAGAVERIRSQLTRCKNVGNFSSPRLLRGAAVEA